MTPTAYFRTHEYMFVFAKGKPKTANLLHDKANTTSNPKKTKGGAGRKGDNLAQRDSVKYLVPDYSRRGSVWRYDTLGDGNLVNGDIPHNQLQKHPAQFPPQLARDHILS